VTDIPARELRNDVSAVLRRVEAGERVRVTVSGRPVAELVPLPAQAASLRREEFVDRFGRRRPDDGLAAQLRQLIPETTDDA
jgi:prevent-host-death family protein